MGLALALALAACAPSKENGTEVLPSSRLHRTVYSARTSSVYAYCYVEFSPLDGAWSPLLLETDTLVACNGVRAQISGTGYYANFEHQNAASVRVTVVRPQTGATVVEFYPIQ